MLNKATTGFLILCLMSNGLLAACSKKSTKDVPNPPEQTAQIPEENNANNPPQQPESPDIKAAEQEKDTDLKDEAQDENIIVKRTHPDHDFSVIEPKSQGIEENPILKEIPGDSFFILASSGNFNFDRIDITDFFRHISTLMLKQIKSMSEDSPFLKATRAFANGIFKTLTPQKFVSLGLAGEVSPQFALYFVRQTPVLRIALSDADKFREIIESYWNQNNVETHRAENVSSHWILVPISEDSHNELAIRWEPDRVTITMINGMDHAGFLLPDIMTAPDEAHSAYKQLSSVNLDDNAMIVGIFDNNAMLNQFAALQEQYKKTADESENPLNMQCVKDLRRMSDFVPKAIIQMHMVSGGSSAGIDLELKFDVKKSNWLEKVADWEPQLIPHPSIEMPVAEFYAALPVVPILEGIREFQNNVQVEPYTCPMLEFLNDIAIPKEAEELFNVFKDDQFIGYTAYKATESGAQSYAATWHSHKAALMAMKLGLLEAESLNKSLERELKYLPDAEKDPKQKLEDLKALEAEKALDDAPPYNPRDYLYDPLAGQDSRAVVVEDAKLNLGEDADFLFKTPNYHVRKNQITLVSDPEILKKITDKPLKPASSLLHFSMSERLLKDLEDSDKERDYQLSADLSVSNKTVDVVIRYAIE